MLGPQARMVLSSSRTWNGWLWLKQAQGLFQSDGSSLWPEQVAYVPGSLTYLCSSTICSFKTEEEEFL